MQRLTALALAAIFGLISCTGEVNYSEAGKEGEEKAAKAGNGSAKAEGVEIIDGEDLSERQEIKGTKGVVVNDIMLFNNKLAIKVPAGFFQMPQELIKSKYPGGNAPQVVYTNDNYSINIAFNYTTSKATAEQLAVYRDVLVKQFNSTLPVKEWLRNEVTEINGKKLIIFSLITQAVDTEVYNLMFITDMHGRLLMGTFNCTQEQTKKWKPVAETIIQTIRIREPS